MIEIRIHGRGGQGAQVACQILASAFFRGGRYVQAFTAYGGERRGAPVTAYLRVDDTPIRVRCDIERPHHALVLDPTMTGEIDVIALRPGGALVVNTPGGASLEPPHGINLVEVDAAVIAQRAGLGPIVATAVMGAFAGATGLVALDDLTAAVEEGSPAKKRENVQACTEAYLNAARFAPAGAQR